jgi:hypothetical protein
MRTCLNIKFRDVALICEENSRNITKKNLVRVMDEVPGPSREL